VLLVVIVSGVLYLGCVVLGRGVVFGIELNEFDQGSI